MYKVTKINRWMAAAMLKIEPKLHKVKNYNNLEKLKEKIKNQIQNIEKESLNFKKVLDILKINSEKLNKYFFVLNKIVKKAKGKKIALVLIPHALDLLNHDQDLLSPVIQKYCVQNGIIFINLKEKFSTFKDHKNITLPCDGHWSPEVHKIVSQILEKELTNFL